MKMSSDATGQNKYRIRLIGVKTLTCGVTVERSTETLLVEMMTDETNTSSENE
jgi:hypothetical protein